MHDATIVEICPATDCNRMQRTATHCNTHAQCEHNQDMRDRPTRIQRKWEPRWHHNIKLHPHPWDTHYQFSINIVLSHDDYEECAHRTFMVPCTRAGSPKLERRSGYAAGAYVAVLAKENASTRLGPPSSSFALSRPPCRLCESLHDHVMYSKYEFCLRHGPLEKALRGIFKSK